MPIHLVLVMIRKSDEEMRTSSLRSRDGTKGTKGHLPSYLSEAKERWGGQTSAAMA